MSLELQLAALASAIGSDVKLLTAAQGNLSLLPTTAKDSLVSALSELAAALGQQQSAFTALINDTAGAGDKTVVWSADKSVAEIASGIDALRTQLVAGAQPALDTFAELAAALGQDPNLAATITLALGNRVRFDAAQTLTADQQLQARANIGALGSADLVALQTGLTAQEAITTTLTSGLAAEVAVTDTLTAGLADQVTVTNNLTSGLAAQGVVTGNLTTGLADQVTETNTLTTGLAAQVAVTDTLTTGLADQVTALTALSAAVGDLTVDLVAAYTSAKS
jgi:hypothetical protein